MEDVQQPASIPAATVIVFRRSHCGGAPEILMITRHRAMTFAGGMAVFPGGRLDQADYELAAHVAGPLDPGSSSVLPARPEVTEVTARGG